MKRYQEAIEAYDKAFEIEPERAQVWRNKGSTLSLMGDRELALVHLRKAVELDPSMAAIAIEREMYRDLWEDAEFKQVVAEAKKAAGE